MEEPTPPIPMSVQIPLWDAINAWAAGGTPEKERQVIVVHEIIGRAMAGGHSVSLQAVLDERRRQDAKWGEQNHPLPTWLMILGEEVGELSQAVLHQTFGGPQAGNVRSEAVQVAAVGMAMVECLDRAIQRTRCPCSFEHPPHDACDGNPGAKFAAPSETSPAPSTGAILQGASEVSDPHYGPSPALKTRNEGLPEAMMLRLHACNDIGSVLGTSIPDAFRNASPRSQAMAIASAIAALWEYVQEQKLWPELRAEWVDEADGDEHDVCMRCGERCGGDEECPRCGFFESSPSAE